MKKLLLSIGLAASVTACGVDPRSPPDQVLTSSKPFNAVAECIQQAAEPDTPRSDLRYQEFSASKSARVEHTYSEGGVTAMFWRVNVKQSGNGSTLEISSLEAFRPKLMGFISGCL